MPLGASVGAANGLGYLSLAWAATDEMMESSTKTTVHLIVGIGWKDRIGMGVRLNLSEKRIEMLLD